MQGGVARGEKRGTRIKSFVKLCHGNGTRVHENTKAHLEQSINVRMHNKNHELITSLSGLKLFGL